MNIKHYFKNRFWDSFFKVSQLLFFVFLPLGANILIAAIDPNQTIFSKIIPGEILAYCLGLIAPLFLFLIKTHGENFKVPALKTIFIISFLLYLLAFLLMIIAKNELINGIDYKSGHYDLYFWFSFSFLIVAILLRLFTDYQESRFIDYKQALDKQQQDFNNNFRKSLG